MGILRRSEIVEEAVRSVDSMGKPNREQSVVRLLYERGHYHGLTCDEQRELDATVRGACEVL